MASDKKIIVLDFEGVVFQARLRELYVDIFKENGRDLNELDHFFNDIFKEKYRSDNCRQKTLAEMTEPLAQQHPEWAKELLAFNADQKFNRYVDELVPGMGEVVDYFSKSEDYELYGLTNWPGDGYRVLEKKFSEVTSKFKDVVVSGDHGCKKPDALIWQIAQERIGNPDPKRVYFFDDKKRNVDACIAEVKWNSFHFTSVESVISVFPDAKTKGKNLKPWAVKP